MLLEMNEDPKFCDTHYIHMYVCVYIHIKALYQCIYIYVYTNIYKHVCIYTLEVKDTRIYWVSCLDDKSPQSGYQVSMSSVKDSHQMLLELSDRRPVRNETALRSTTDNESRPTGETGWPIKKADTLNSLIKQQKKLVHRFLLNTAHV